MRDNSPGTALEHSGCRQRLGVEIMFKAHRYLPAAFAVVVLTAMPACASYWLLRWPVRQVRQCARRRPCLPQRYNEGRSDGENDARRGRSFDYGRHDDYRDATTHRGGNRNYRQDFRQRIRRRLQRWVPALCPQWRPPLAGTGTRVRAIRPDSRLCVACGRKRLSRRHRARTRRRTRPAALRSGPGVALPFWRSRLQQPLRLPRRLQA